MRQYENTATQRGLWLEAGWNAVVLSLILDAESVDKLQSFPVLRLEEENQAYVQANSFTADDLYWIYAEQARRIVLTGEAAPSVHILPANNWQPFGNFPELQLAEGMIWHWHGDAFRRVPDARIIPGGGYFILMLP